MIESKKFKLESAGTPLLIPLAVLLLVGGSTLTLAQPHGPGGGFSDRGPMLDRVIEKLDLSAAQQEELEELLAENRDEHRAQWEAAKTARRTLSDQIHATEFDEGAIRQAAAAVADIEEELAVSRALMFQQVQQILTPEQQAQMREMMGSLREFREDWGGRQRGRRGRN